MATSVHNNYGRYQDDRIRKAHESPRILSICLCKNQQDPYNFERVEISADETLGNLKKMICRKLDVPYELNEFSLFLYDNRGRVWQPIEESNTLNKLSNYDFPQSIKITLQKKKSNFHETSKFSEHSDELILKVCKREFDDSDYIPIRIRSSETISQLREKARERLNHKNLSCLFRFKNNRWIKLEEKLDSYPLEIFNFTPHEMISFSLTSDSYTPGLCGLTNLGSTCFINSALQCLSNIPKFNEAILSMDEDLNAPIIGSFVKLMKQIWSGKCSTFAPSTFISNVRENLPRFTSYRQYDAQEFLNDFLRLIHQEFTNERTLISKFFYGTIRSSITCFNSCKSTEINDETFSFIPLPVDNNMNQYRAVYVQANGCQKGIVTIRVCGTTIGDLIQSFIDQHETKLKFSQINAFRISKNKIIEEYLPSHRLYWVEKNELTLIEMPEKSDRQFYTELVFIDESTKEPFRPPLFLVRPRDGYRYSDLVHQIKEIQSNLFPNDKKESLKCKLYYRTYDNQDYEFYPEANDQHDLYFPKKVFMITHHSSVLKYKESHNFDTGSPKLKPSVSGLLAEFFREQSLCGDYLCSKCEKMVQAKQKSVLIAPLPPVMIIQLKRFTFEVNSTEKIDTLIEFPLENLDFTPFIEQSGTKKSNLYDLVAVSNHIGSLVSGHYFTYAKNKINQKWYSFNDDSTPKILDEDRIVTKDAYILVYVQKS